jgi:hypothetical protein
MKNDHERKRGKGGSCHEEEVANEEEVSPEVKLSADEE